MPSKLLSLPFFLILLFSAAGFAQSPLHKQIDELIIKKAGDKPISPKTDDAEFLRRVYLDFAGRIPPAAQTRAFLADTSADKRANVIDQLLSNSDYPKRMADVFHIMFMERIGENPAWMKYLTSAFAENRPWDRMAREILKADRDDPASAGAAFFMAKRLDKIGQQTTDYPGLARDIGRLFLGKNFQCAQCHDHLFIDEYKQQHFQGLFAFIQKVYIVDMDGPTIAENATTEKVSFMSVFKKINKQTGPALPGGKEIEIPVFKKGEEYVSKPDPRNRKPGVPKFSTLAQLADNIADPSNKDFARNIVNRLWFVEMGRGLVHPLDLHHKDNPASHPELLELLANEFVAHKFDIKWLLREMAMTETYQRSSVLPKGVDKVAPELFQTAIERKVTAEQLLDGILEATGERERHLAAKKDAEIKTESLPALRTKFLKAFANAAREPEEEFNPSLRAALFILNDPTVLEWLTARPGNLIDRLANENDNKKAAEELYLSVLTRLPNKEEKAAVDKFLAKHKADRPAALGRLAWAMLASTEFSVNH